MCREAGGRVTANVMLRDLDLALPDVADGRRLEVVADGLPLFGGAQLVIDTTLVCALRKDGNPTSHAANGKNERSLNWWAVELAPGWSFSLWKWGDGLKRVRSFLSRQCARSRREPFVSEACRTGLASQMGFNALLHSCKKCGRQPDGAAWCPWCRRRDSTNTRGGTGLSLRKVGVLLLSGRHCLSSDL